MTLLFTDIVMPDMNGRKLADEAVRRRPALKVLYTTGYTSNAIIHNGVLDPGVHLITKPFTLEQLAAQGARGAGSGVRSRPAGLSSTRNYKSLRRRPLTRRWWTFALVHTNGSAFSL